LLAIAAALALLGCSKSVAFKPESIERGISYDDRLTSPVVARTPNAALTEAGEIISQEPTAKRYLAKGETLLGVSGDFVIASNGEQIVIYGQDSWRVPTQEPIVSAATDGKALATISSDNLCRIIDLKTKKTLFMTQERLASAVTSRIASPLLTQRQIIFPTLDGKLIVVDRATNTISRELIISADEFFANPIFLDLFEGAPIVASHNRIVLLGERVIIKDINLRLVALFDDRLFVFGQDGEVRRLNTRLESIASYKLPYARFVAAARHNGALFAVEQSGYLARFDDDLTSAVVYELPDSIRSTFFAQGDRLYYHNKIIRWRVDE
jgi:hypothetical protein